VETEPTECVIKQDKFVSFGARHRSTPRDIVVDRPSIFDAGA
jgi:hypothetical protein